jgi:Ca2+/Na+ antiporter
LCQFLSRDSSGLLQFFFFFSFFFFLSLSHLRSRDVLLGSFVALVFASWCVGEGGEILGAKFDASVVGGLIIAWLNTAPEAIFFLQALNSGNPRFAMGAVSGSAIVVCTVAVGACVWIGASARKSGNFYLLPSVKKQCYVLAASTAFPFGIALYGYSVVGGIAAFLFYCAFLVYSLTNSSTEAVPAPAAHKKQDIEEGGGGAGPVNGQVQQSKKLFDDVLKCRKKDDDIELVEDEDDHANAPTIKGVGFLLVGGVLIFLCSSPFITAVVEASAVLKGVCCSCACLMIVVLCSFFFAVSPTLLAFFLAPVASEMPEILEAVSLSRKGHVQAINVAYSNLIGGTITKTTLMCGIFSLFGVWKVICLFVLCVFGVNPKIWSGVCVGSAKLFVFLVFAGGLRLVCRLGWLFARVAEIVARTWTVGSILGCGVDAILSQWQLCGGFGCCSMKSKYQNFFFFGSGPECRRPHPSRRLLLLWRGSHRKL